LPKGRSVAILNLESFLRGVYLFWSHLREQDYEKKAISNVVMGGCDGDGADEQKPIGDVQAEVDKLDVDQLRAKAQEYQKQILSKQEEVTKLADKIKEIPVTELLGDEAKNLKADLEDLNKSLKNLKDRFQVYYDKLKEKGGDVSGLES
jgi:chromosome segregation ATPase